MSTLKATNLSHASAASPNIALDSAGKVTFGGAVVGSGMDLITTAAITTSSNSVNNCFTATYTNYKIVAFMTTGGTSSFSFRLRVGGVDTSGSLYNYQRTQTGGTTMTATRTTAAAEWLASSPVTGLNYFEWTIYRPAVAATTAAILYMGREVSSTIDSDFYSLGHNAATAFDGFTFGYGSTATGSLSVYGLKI